MNKEMLEKRLEELKSHKNESEEYKIRKAVKKAMPMIRNVWGRKYFTPGEEHILQNRLRKLGRL